MAKYYDIDNDVRINGKLTVNGDTTIPSSFNLLVGGNITGNTISGGTIQASTINGTNATLTNVTSSGTVSGSSIKGDGSTLVVNSVTANGGNVPISNGWAYTHENKTGALGHIPNGGSATTFLRGDGTWATPTDTDTYVNGLSSTAGGNGTLTVSRNTGGNLTINLSHTHPFSQVTSTPTTLSGYGITDSAPKYIASNGTAYGRFTETGFTPLPMFGDEIRFRKPTLVEYFDGSSWVTWSTTAFDILTDGKGNTSVNIDYTHKNFRVTYDVDAYNGADLIWVSSAYNAPGGTLLIESTSDNWATTNVRSSNSPLGAYWRYTSMASVSGDTKVRFTFDCGLSSGNTFNLNQIMMMTSRPAEQGGSMETLFPFVWDINKNLSTVGNITANSFTGSGNSLTVSGTPANGSLNPINSGWAYTHTNTTGIGSHVPTGGTTSNFLRGDGTWQIPVDTNNYLTGVSSTAGGNGTITFTRQGLSSLTLDASHTHSQYVLNNTDNQVMNTGLNVKGNMFVGTTGTAGSLYVRNSSNTNVIQLVGDTSAKGAGIKAQINANGDAIFDGILSGNSLKVTDTTIVSNLNAEMVGGTKESKIAKNLSIRELGGSGVFTGLNITQQTVPNMTVLINSGVVYTDTGMRVDIPNTSISLATSSATYDRKDVIYIQGSSAGANEGVPTVATGTPASTPIEPSIPSDAIKLAVVSVLRNIGSIQDVHITDTRVWKMLRYRSTTNDLCVEKLSPNIYSSNVATANFDKPIKGSTFASSIVITAGNTSATWNHNLGLGTNYTITFSWNNAEPHVYWSNKATNSIVLNLDDICESDVTIDCQIMAY
jgi:hypothetical protein